MVQNTQVPEGSAVFSGKGGSLSPTTVGPGYSGSRGSVGTIGGAGGKEGEGYGVGGKSMGGGRGASFVAVEGGVGGTVDEGLSMDEVGAVIHSHMDEVRYCHELALQYQSPIEGKLSVKFWVTPQGLIGQHGVDSSTLPEKVLAGCLLKKLASWKFPKPRGGVAVAVTYPFIFKMLERN